MSARIACAAMLPLAFLAGCATEWDRSYARWRGYIEVPGPYSSWARCVRDRSYHHLDPDGSGVRAVDAGMFPRVLGDCAETMTQPVWAGLSDRQKRQLLADAYQAFRIANADLMAQQEAGVTERSSP